LGRKLEVLTKTTILKLKIKIPAQFTQTAVRFKEPTTYQEALKSPECEKWMQAIENEIKYLEELEVFKWIKRQAMYKIKTYSSTIVMEVLISLKSDWLERNFHKWRQLFRNIHILQLFCTQL
jgi:hypothetical protein